MLTSQKIVTVCCLLILSISSYGNDFSIDSSKPSFIIVDRNDLNTVHTSVKHFSNDIKLVTGKAATIKLDTNNISGNIIIVGSLTNSKYIKQLVNKKVIKTSTIIGKWENFTIQVVENPFPNVKKALVIIGSDRRGTAFGIFEVSRRLGVSPWYWWADVTPIKQKNILLKGLPYYSNTPSVKYRGIFLNDEDWGLKPWAAKKIDTDIKDIGPKTYAHIFELLLRLKANFIWPAMHPCTKAFYYYPENPKIAEQYGIVVGSSHCEPMLRNNVYEWKRNFQNEYHKKPGAWRYDTNRKEIYKYWNDRVKESNTFESIYTVGMRGIHDSSMPGGKNFQDKIRLMNEVIKDQRQMLNDTFGNKAIPQIFCPYKEVLKLYKAGMKLPADITLTWADDNHGYIRQLSTPTEQKRSGRAGVYYHLSYWGAPQDYLWISSISPALISFEMSKAYAYGADRLWVFNVGDIKPAECEIEFALDLAWNIKEYQPNRSIIFLQQWAEENFGKSLTKQIVEIKLAYYRLAQRAKPEHMNKVSFSIKALKNRLAEYNKLEDMINKISPKIARNRKDAFFQLLEYPVKSAINMNRKYLNAMLSNFGDAKSNEYAKKATKAFASIKEMTQWYNKSMAKGKWDGIISYRPRGLSVYNMPNIGSNSINLAAKDFKYNPTMKLENGILSGNSNKICKSAKAGASISFNLKQAGKYNLYLYALCPDDKHDSWFFEVNNNKFIVNDFPTGGTWKWIKVKQINFSKGENIIKISQREPNALIKEICITKGSPKSFISDPIITIEASDFVKNIAGDKGEIITIPELGISKNSVSIYPMTMPSLNMTNIDKSPRLIYEFKGNLKDCRIEVNALPTFAIHKGRNLCYAIQVDEGTIQMINLNTDSHSSKWYKNTMRGYSIGTTLHHLKEREKHTITIYLLDPGIVINRLQIYKTNRVKNVASILIAGDSIVATYPGKNPKQQGWGQQLDDLLNNDGIISENFAVSGKSTKTFKKDWQHLAKKIDKNTFVFIQFGHNDSHKKSLNEATNPNKDYKDNLIKYIRDAKNRGGIPILVTPPTRRYFIDGKLQTFINSKTVGPSNLLPFVNAMKEVAKSEQVTLVDLFTATFTIVQLLGEKKASKLYTDMAHSTGLGAKMHAQIIIQSLVDQNHLFAKYVNKEKLNNAKLPNIKKQPTNQKSKTNFCKLQTQG